MLKPTRCRSNRRRYALTLPELEHSKAAVLNSLGSLQSRRSYKYAIEELIRWYCSDPRLALNRAVVLRYRPGRQGPTRADCSHTALGQTGSRFMDICCSHSGGKVVSVDSKGWCYLGIGSDSECRMVRRKEMCTAGRDRQTRPR